MFMVSISYVLFLDSLKQPSWEMWQEGGMTPI